MIAQSIIGTGTDSVYLYYYENDRKLAEFEGRDRWECKIGEASNNALQRVRSQINTATARNPVLAVEIKTDYSYRLESLLHKFFKNFKLDDEYGGDEWFLINPEEFKNAGTEFLKTMEIIRDSCNIIPNSITYLVENYEDWSNVVSQLRCDRGLSQSQLTELSGVRQATISAIENGGDVKFSTISKLLKNLGYSIMLIKTDTT